VGKSIGARLPGFSRLQFVAYSTRLRQPRAGPSRPARRSHSWCSNGARRASLRPGLGLSSAPWYATNCSLENPARGALAQPGASGARTPPGAHGGRDGDSPETSRTRCQSLWEVVGAAGWGGVGNSGRRGPGGAAAGLRAALGRGCR
jgi:hypothetical protein